jgi:murein DD-endopeptidase MepM/ murein hydrolase activator NlpD
VTPVAVSPTAPDVTPTATKAPSLEPHGFPIDPETRLGSVEGRTGARTIAWAGGPAARDYSRLDQASDDPVRANGSGWDCRVHQKYEGQPAVDWYVPDGTPVMATMDGEATLYVVTVTNAFDFYGVSREPYLGNPDRSRAQLSPFPGPGGGKGVFVSVDNGAFVTEYAHLDMARTATIVPAGAFLAGYSPATDLASRFGPLRDFRTFDAVARWSVSAGEVIGFSGESGYSEAPHLHYTVRRAGGPLLCPTGEPGYSDGAWLLK